MIGKPVKAGVFILVCLLVYFVADRRQKNALRYYKNHYIELEFLVRKMNQWKFSGDSVRIHARKVNGGIFKLGEEYLVQDNKEQETGYDFKPSLFFGYEIVLDSAGNVERIATYKP